MKQAKEIKERCLKAYDMRKAGHKFKDIADFFSVSNTCAANMARRGKRLKATEKSWHRNTVSGRAVRAMEQMGYGARWDLSKKEIEEVRQRLHDIMGGSAKPRGVGGKTIAELCDFFSVNYKKTTDVVTCPHCGKSHGLSGNYIKKREYMVSTGPGSDSKNKKHWHKGQVSSLGINAVSRILGEYRPQLNERDIELIKDSLKDAAHGRKQIFMAGRKTIHELCHFFEVKS